jgi:hypothetical protein
MIAPRRGHSLPELLATLPLAAVALLVAATALLDAHRVARWTDHRVGSARELRHAAFVLESDLRPLDAGDLHAVHDSLVEFDAVVGVGVACGSAADGRTLHLLPAGGDDPLRTHWAAAPAAGDVVEYRRGRSDLVGPPEIARVALDAVRSDGAACATSPLRADAGPAVALALAGPGSPASLSLHEPAHGTVVRVLRRTVLASYRDGRGRWMLGRRALVGGRWEAIQPVAGPLRPPRQGGFTARALDADGAPVAILSAAAQLQVTLAAADGPALRRGAGSTGERLVVHVALRGRPTRPDSAP